MSFTGKWLRTGGDRNMVKLGEGEGERIKAGGENESEIFWLVLQEKSLT